MTKVELEEKIKHYTNKLAIITASGILSHDYYRMQGMLSVYEFLLMDEDSLFEKITKKIETRITDESNKRDELLAKADSSYDMEIIVGKGGKLTAYKELLEMVKVVYGK
jgi:hypothetical protein